VSVARYLLGIAALTTIICSLAVATVCLRARFLPDWNGAPARLAESVIAFALLTAILEVLGAVGLFRLAPIVAAVLLTAAGLARAVGVPRGVGLSARLDRDATRSRRRLAHTAIAIGSAAAVTAEWTVPTLHSYDIGIRAFDSLWYHLPWAASFAQTGQITGLRFTDVEYLTPFYPATAELFHGLGIVLLGRDTLSPVLNLGFLGLVLLAGYCIGRPRGLGPVTMTGAALAMALPMIRFSQAGSAANDVVGVFFLIASAALLAHARTRAALALAAIAAGLAIGTKLSLLAPALALAVAAVAIAPRERRRAAAGVWAAGVLAAGGFWFLRDLIAVGNPLPWTGLGILPTPAPPLQHHTAFSVVHYLSDGRIWTRYLEPGLSDGLGPLWPLILAAAIIAPLLCVAWRGSGAVVRMLGVVALVSLVAYLITPEGAAGPGGRPSGFAFNLRYAAPWLTIALTTAPLAPPLADERARDYTLGGLAVLLLATLAQSRLWPAGYAGGGLLVGALVAAAAGAALAIGGRRAEDGRRLPLSPALLAAGAVALLLAGSAAGYAGQRHYLRGRYVFQPRVSSLSTLWQWFRGVHDSRVGLVGTFGGFFAYPLFGLDDSNRVDYVARRGRHGSFIPIASCPDWRRAVNAGHYRYVVTTPARDPWKPRVLTRSPEGDWTASDPAARAVFRQTAVGQTIVVHELTGPLDPARCR
jgi:hypothetical protein